MLKKFAILAAIAAATLAAGCGAGSDDPQPTASPAPTSTASTAPDDLQMAPIEVAQTYLYAVTVPAMRLTPG